MRSRGLPRPAEKIPSQHRRDRHLTNYDNSGRNSRMSAAVGEPSAEGNGCCIFSSIAGIRSSAKSSRATPSHNRTSTRHDPNTGQNRTLCTGHGKACPCDPSENDKKLSREEAGQKALASQ